jgi:alpha-galactosidase
VVKDTTNVPNLASTPPIGWCSWHNFGVNINENKIKSAVDFVVNNGLKDFGLSYIMIDAGWEYILPQDADIIRNSDGSYSRSNDGTIIRDSNGIIVPDASKFPNGMKAIVDYIHERGLKAGIYSSPGKFDCVRSMGSMGFEQIDANTFAEWGFDMLKYDNCSLNTGMYEAYSKMAKCLQSTGRDFLYYLCLFKKEKCWKWGAKVGHYWRMTLDPSGYFINPEGVKPVDVLRAYETALSYIDYNQPNGWNDCTDIVVTSSHMSDIEIQSHFALFCFLNLPIIFEGNLNLLSEDRLNIIKNKYLISLQKDVANMAHRVYQSETYDVLVKDIRSGVAILFLNKSDSTYSYNGDLSEYLSGYIGIGKIYDALNNGNLLGSLGDTINISLNSHQTCVLIIR